MRLLDPRNSKVLERLDQLRRQILHALKHDHATTGRNDAVSENFEHMSNTESLNFILKQFLGRLDQAALYFSDANSACIRCQQTLFDEQLSEEVRLAASPPTMRGAVASGCKKWTKDFGCLNAQAGQGSPYQYHE